MQAIIKVLLTGLLAFFAFSNDTSARGQTPPPPPFIGGSSGDWLGSGPIFGFEVPNVKNPFAGGGIGSGGANGGWGGSWWNGDGPLGGGGWGGWGGWGSGLGPGAGGLLIDSDTSKKGHIWPEDEPIKPRSNCFVTSEVGGKYRCGCQITYPPNTPSGTIVRGICVRWDSGDNYHCLGINQPCTGINR